MGHRYSFRSTLIISMYMSNFSRSQFYSRHTLNGSRATICTVILKLHELSNSAIRWSGVARDAPSDGIIFVQRSRFRHDKNSSTMFGMRSLLINGKSKESTIGKAIFTSVTMESSQRSLRLSWESDSVFKRNAIEKSIQPNCLKIVIIAGLLNRSPSTKRSGCFGMEGNEIRSEIGARARSRGVQRKAGRSWPSITACYPQRQQIGPP